MSFTEDKLDEFCGVFGIACNDFSYSVAGLIYTGLMAIQHRGQLSSGISTSSCNGQINTYCNRGLVFEVLNHKRLQRFLGNIGIGHVGYGIPDNTSREEIQPYHFKSTQMEFSIAMNGTISNYNEIYNKLREMGRIFTNVSDIELLAILIDTLSKFSETLIETLTMVMKTIKGAYSIILLTAEGNLYALRDPLGYKPLCYGKLKKNNNIFWIISSESCSLDALGAELKRDITPGEIILCNPLKEIKKVRIQKQKRQKMCYFEYSYFARPDSIIEGISVADVRYNLGKNLAKNEDLHLSNAIVVPVPDSGRSAAMGYAKESGLQYQEGLMKNRYLWQIGSSPNEKLNAIKTIVNKNKIILIDDSILSGNTLKQIISMLREAGAQSIHVRISIPPIINYCQLNKSFSTKNRLIAFEKKLQYYDNFNEEMRKYIGADTLKYQTIESLIDAVGLEKNRICLECLMEYCLVNDDQEKKVAPFQNQ
ncbi:MAG: amidophosphoribosyltransferase [Promethearchaeota archaeon]